MNASALLTEEDIQRRQRITLRCLIVARCLNASALGLAVVASPSLLYKLATPGSGEHNVAVDASVHRRVQSLQTNIETVVTLLNFFAASPMGHFLDAAGRLPSMLIGLMGSGLVRLAVVTRPSSFKYFWYRVVVSICTPMFMRATDAALGDLYGPGTVAKAQATSTIQKYTLPSMLCGTFASRWLKRPQKAFMVCSALQLAAVATLLAGMRETIPVRRKMQWSMDRVNPLSFIQLYRHSRALSAIAILSLLRELPAYIGSVDAVYQRTKFKEWGQDQDKTLMMVAQVSGFLPLREAAADGLPGPPGGHEAPRVV